MRCGRIKSAYLIALRFGGVECVARYAKAVCAERYERLEHITYFMYATSTTCSHSALHIDLIAIEKRFMCGLFLELETFRLTFVHL